MTDKLPPLSTQTAPSYSTLPPLNPPPLPPPPSAAYTISPASTVLPPLAAASPPTRFDGASNDTVPRAASEVSNNDIHVSKAEEAAEEEPYTIKCICGFTGDDGNTIYCDDCDSWQHIVCFYPDNSEEATREEFAHACHECKPRPLDVEHAVETQQQRAQLDAASAETVISQKTKRPPTKNHGQSHKKKAKPTELQLNGHATLAADGSRQSLSAHEAAPPKKSKHKSSHSVSSHKRSPSYGISRSALQSGRPLSPATTPPDLPDSVHLHNYSSDLLTLCSGQDAVVNVTANTFVNLAVSNAMSVWLREPDRMRQETGHEYADVFQSLPPDMESAKQTPRVEIKKRVISHDAIVQWPFLAASVAVDKLTPLMELNGEVGFQKDYCAYPPNRYGELSSPLPFVFFHPLLPLCIDTRREGSLARYVRRSCRPNAVLDTFQSGGSQYQFWLVSDRAIAANEQITIPWDFRLPLEQKRRWLHLLGLGDDDSPFPEDMDVEEEDYMNISRWIHLVLSEYGGCACDLGNECAFVRFHRNYSLKSQQARFGLHSSGHHSKKKAARKHKQQQQQPPPAPHVLSPTSNGGHPTNSRAVSEGHADDYFEVDKSSTASRSKPPSRDMTPAPRQGSFDTLGILTEPTDRDKRKVAMVEDSFRRLEQQPLRKKKRTSEGTSISEKVPILSTKARSKSSSSGSTAVATGYSNGHMDDHVDSTISNDVYTVNTKSHSKPDSPRIASPHAAGKAYPASRQFIAGARAKYRDAEVQTDPTEGEWYSARPAPAGPRRRVISVAKLLLSQRKRFRLDDSCTWSPSLPTGLSSMGTGSLPVVGEAKESLTDKLGPAVSSSEADTTMSDAPAVAIKTSPSLQQNPMPSALSLLPAPPSEPSVLSESNGVKVEADQGAAAKLDAASTPTAAPAATAEAAPEAPLKKSPDLRVQLPPLPAYSEGPLTQTSSTATPLTASSMVQSPFAMAGVNAFGITTPNGTPLVAPSPIKKKMSLSDYTKSRKAAAGRPPVVPPSKPTTAGADGPVHGESPSTSEKATVDAP